MLKNLSAAIPGAQFRNVPRGSRAYRHLKSFRIVQNNPIEKSGFIKAPVADFGWNRPKTRTAPTTNITAAIPSSIRCDSGPNSKSRLKSATTITKPPRIKYTFSILESYRVRLTWTTQSSTLDAVFLFEAAEGAAIFAGFERGVGDVAAVFVEELFDVALFEGFDGPAAAFVKVGG